MIQTEGSIPEGSAESTNSNKIGADGDRSMLFNQLTEDMCNDAVVIV